MAEGNEKQAAVVGLSFEFVADEALRASLAKDAHELSVASAGGAHKSTVVLAGSIIETILLDHLVSTDHLQRTGNDPTKFEFWKLIETCHEEGVISDRTKQLLHAVRDYRNLIHPGRSLRLKEQVTAGISTVAHGVVGVVSAEMAERPNSRFGMTAEQVLTKVRQDPKIIGMLDHILSAVRSTELDRLVVKTLPAAFVEGIGNPDGPFDDVPDAVRMLYRTAFMKCSQVARTAHIEDLCHAIQNDSGADVHVLLANTFVGWYLQYAPNSKEQLIVDRLLVETRGQHLPFQSTAPYEYLLNVMSVDASLRLLRDLRYSVRRWSQEDRNKLSSTLLTNPKWNNFAVADGAAAAAHFKVLSEKIRLEAERPSPFDDGGVFASWLHDILEGSEFPF